MWHDKLTELNFLCHEVIQLLSKSLNTLSYFTQPLYHPSFSILLKILKSRDFNASFQNNSIFYSSYIKCIEQGVFRIERITFSRYYVVNLEKCEIVFKLLASNCISTKKRSLLVYTTSKSILKHETPELSFVYIP